VPIQERTCEHLIKSWCLNKSIDMMGNQNYLQGSELKNMGMEYGKANEEGMDGSSVLCRSQNFSQC
jgi:hypothetical protein